MKLSDLERRTQWTQFFHWVHTLAPLHKELSNLEGDTSWYGHVVPLSGPKGRDPSAPIPLRMPTPFYAERAHSTG